MAQIRLKGPQIGSDLGAVSATVGGNTDSTTFSSFLKPGAISGLPRLSDGFDGDTLTVDVTGLTNVSNYNFRIVGGSSLQNGATATFDSTGQGGNWIEVEVTADPSATVYTSPAVQVYAKGMMASHAADDASIIALVPHAQSTHIAVANGNWNDAATWQGGRIPYNGARVLIPQGLTVTYNRSSRYRLDWVRVDGTLTWALDRNTDLLVETMICTRGGQVIIGTSSNRLPSQYRADITISGKYYDSNSYTETELGNGAIANDPRLWGRGFIWQGEFTAWGAEKLQWTMAAEGVASGATSITLSETPTGWQVGDEICISGTAVNYTAGSNPLTRQDEYRTITAINGATVSWSDGLTYNHNNQLSGSSRTDIVPAVFLRDGNNIRISSEVTDVEYLRGHTAAVHGYQTTDVWNVSFVGLGRTNKSTPAGILNTANGNFRYHDWSATTALQETTFTTQSNIQSRYPVHTHHPGFQGVSGRPKFVSCYVEDAPGWAMVDHGGSSFFFGNVIHLFYGCGMVSEAANEVGVWQKNLACGATSDLYNTHLTSPKTNGGPAEPAGDLFRGGFGFGMRGRAMRVNSNVAASCTWGYVFFHRDNVEVPSTSLVDTIKPRRENLDLKTVGQVMQGNTFQMALADYPIIHFEDNMALACLAGGFITKESPLQKHDVNVHIKRFKSFGYAAVGFELEYIGGYLLEDIDCVAGPGVTGLVGFSIAQNTYQVGFKRLRTEGNNVGLRIFDNLDSQQAMISTKANPFNATNNPRWYVLGYQSINDLTRIEDAVDLSGKTPTRDLDMADVLLDDPDWTSDTYDLKADPVETFPLSVCDVAPNGTVTNPATDPTDGAKTDELGIHPVAVKTWNDRIWKRDNWGAYGFAAGFYQYDGNDVIVSTDLISDRASARPKLITKMGIMTSTPGWPDRGAFSYTATPVTANDVLSTVATDGSVAVDVVTASSAAGGTGTVVLHTDNYIAPGHGEVEFSGNTITYSPDSGYAGVDTMYAFVESDGQYATVRLDWLVGPGGSVTTPVAGADFSAADGGAQSIDVTLNARPACGGRRIQVVEYSTDAGVTWRRLSNGWIPSVYNISVESDGTAVAAGSYNLRIRFRTDYDFTKSGDSADHAVTVA